ncbi:hypothetical protein NP493_168g01024 [Ridgeia piscesae]|uniref:BZIP domain-containing protein n=1 Tax=Ridgeia piscesae TaxID=27915 RepID=A0AAD9P3G2_RIDPI|nr:hypothetical protein NP493_168g01024 [Ridgeia piscesae]
MKHEMSLPLTPGLKPGQLLTFADQTPTPTRFLRNCEEIGLFSELKSNPFEEAFKKASEFIGPDGKSVEQPGQTSAVADTTAECGNLNTPTPLLMPRHPPVPSSLALAPSQLQAAPPPFVPLPGPNKDVGSTVTPTSPITVDKRSEVTVDSPVLRPPVSPVTSPNDSNTAPQKSVIASAAAVATTVAIATSASAVTTPPSLSASVTTTRAPSVVSAVVGAPVVPRVGPTGTQQYMLQVMVRMPSGDMMPVQIPAAPAPLAPAGIPTALVSVATSVTPSTTVASVPVTAVPTTTPATLSTKQILKAALQQQSMKVTGDELVRATHQVSPPLRTLVNRTGRSQTIIRSAVTLPAIAATSPVMVTSPSGAFPSVMSPRLQVHDVDTSTPLKRSRSSSPEEDSDERRRKFLERNRAAAARCRAKKKMWIGGLEKRAEDMQDVNARLQHEVTQLRNEVAELKSLLLAHKDCPITLQQRNAGRLAFTTITPKVEPPDNSAANVTGATETAKSTSASSQDLSHVTVTASPTRSAAQPIILNIMPLVQDGS